MIRLRIFFQVILAATILTNAKGASTPDSVLDKKLGEFRLFSGNELDVCRVADVPCGWELSEDDTTAIDPRRRIKIPKGNFKDALKRIASHRTKYQWNLNKGVVNFVPKSKFLVTSHGKRASEVIISSISIHDEKVNVAARKICDVAGLECAAVGSAGARQHFGRVTVDLSDVTLTEALNAIVATDGKSAWRLRYDKSVKKFVVEVVSWRAGPSLFGTSESQEGENTPTSQ